MVYGYGHETWEWTIKTPIRSALHPFMYAIIYWVLNILGLDSDFMVAYSPRLLQGILTTVTDYYIFKIAYKIFNDRYIAQLSVLLTLASWSMNYCMVRTLSNSIETTLMMIAFYYWMELKEKYSKKDTLIAALYTLAFLLRPTSAIISFTLVICQIMNHKFIAIKNLFMSFFLGAVPIILLGIGVDTWYYGKFSFPMYYFAKINIIDGISTYNGRFPVLWYLTSGIPLFLVTYIPFSGYGLYKAMNELVDCTIAYIIMTYFTIMSLLTHKEDRYMLPIIPLLIILAAYCISAIRKKAPKWSTFFLVFTVLTQIIFLCIVNNIYRVGSIPLMDELRTLPENKLRSVYFLTPCHSTPFYSHIHRYFYALYLSKKKYNYEISNMHTANVITNKNL